MSSGQLVIDYDYDERVVRLSAEFALMLVPHLPPGTKRETIKTLADRFALLASKRLKDAWEPPEPIRCHTCDEMTTVPGNRVRVAVCNRCSFLGRSPGSSG